MMIAAATRPRRFLAAALVAMLALAARPAPAVVIQTLSGTGNTTAPPDDPGWNNVSLRGNGTAVYLGERWVLSVNHTTSGSVTFNGQAFSEVAGTRFSLTNNGVPDKSAVTDLILFQINGTPTGVPSIPIARTTPAVDAAVTMIGGGRDRGAFTEWDTSTSPWTEVTSGGDAAGYKAASTRALRWGTNAVSGGSDWILFGARDVLTFRTTFDFAAGTSEAQALAGDSGGPVFVKNGGQWELAGMMVTVAGFIGQPNPALTAVFGNETYMADLSFYRPQIVAVVPEPAAAQLAGAAVAAGAVWAVIRRRRNTSGPRPSLPRQG